MKSNTYITNKHAWTSIVSKLCVCFSIIAALIPLITPHSANHNGIFDIVAAALLSTVIIVGLILMFFSTYEAIKFHRSIDDAVVFLFVAWVFPFFGIIFLLAFARPVTRKAGETREEEAMLRKLP